MSSAPGLLATHEAISRQGPMTNKNLQLKTCKISHSQYACECLQEAVFTNTQNLFKLDSPPPLPQRTAAEHCVCCIQENGGSIQFLLTASSCHCQKRALQELHTQPLRHFWILQHIVNTYVPAKYLTPLLQNFLRLNTGNDKHPFCNDTQLCKNQNLPFLLKSENLCEVFHC